MDNWRKMLAPLLYFVGLCLLAPFLTIFLTILFIYRRIVEIALRIEHREDFAGLLEGEDALWAVEEPTALSVINVLGLLESKNEPSFDLLDKFRDLVKSRLANNSSFEKLFYRRQKKYGYYFWLKERDFRPEDRVKWLEHDYFNCDGSCNDIYGESLKKSVENLCNQPLPADHSTSWEILIGRKCPRCHVRRFRPIDEGKLLFAGRTKKETIPILFRIHHSLGDGEALTKLLLDAIADRETPEEHCSLMEDEEFKVKRRTNGLEFNLPDDNELMFPVKDVLGPRMPYTYLVTLRFAGKFMQNYVCGRIKFFHSFSYEAARIRFKYLVMDRFKRLEYIIRKTGWQRLRNIAKIIVVAFNAPASLVDQALKSMDNSALHGPKLSGEKFISCWLENDFRNSSQQKLLLKMRDIKNSTGARIEDIFLAALSSSFHKYLIQIDEMPPKKLSVVLPRRMGPANGNLVWGNNFSIEILPLCISEANDEPLSDPTENTEIFERLRDVSKVHDKLKEDSDYLINLWVMKYLCAVLPDNLARFILESHSTMILSNLPGPQVIRILGYTLKNIAFWIPNRSSTGISCSIFSYGNDLQISLVADKVVMKDSKCLSEILENTVREIDNLHDSLMRSCFAKKFGNVNPATME